MRLTKINNSEDGAQRPRILYVEDEDSNWEVAVLGLRGSYELSRAINAREAFTWLAREKFAIILMDIQLSGSDLDGIAITEILKGKYRRPIPAYAEGITSPETPVIFVTAYSARYNKELLKQVGGADLITKPVNFAKLSGAMSRYLTQAAMTKIDSLRRA